VPNPETKYKRSKIVFSVTTTAFTVVHICTELLQLSAQSLIGSSGTLPVRVLGCNNGIGGFHKNLVTFWGTKLPGFL